MFRDTQAVGQAAMPTLLIMLEREAPEDMETAKAVLEAVNLLCEVEEGQDEKVRLNHSCNMSLRAMLNV